MDSPATCEKCGLGLAVQALRPARPGRDAARFSLEKAFATDFTDDTD